MAAAAAASFAVGAVAAWVGTAVLNAGVSAGAMLAGIAAWAIYLAFVVATVALSAGVSRSVVGTAGLTAVALLLLPIAVQVFPALRPWSPSTLVGAIVEMVEGAAATDYVRAALVALGVALAALWGSVRLLSRREV